ncbi:hypothetical protein FOB82_07635 [Corynebacterium xerosis]|uniref:Anti-sigma-D factor RsdA sigma factor binding region domain-containing protein n=1 Tax=Corynebacterium xerosis TaxID=1725 RepID=A0A6B8TPE9_9CORY|nr:hypothetical protein [Corynebacterium xerosis]QGS34846.1 hypothetical protein FOB82_07635 [Corynebacterium xerosis]
MDELGKHEKEAEMVDRRDRRYAGRDDAVSGVERMPTPQELAADDRFLDDLAAGCRDVSGAGVYGTDSYLASLIADARDAADSELPPLPAIDPGVAVAHRDVVDVEVVPADADADAVVVVDAAADADSGSGDAVPGGAAKGGGAVVRGPSSWWKPSRMGSALIGAAASLALVAGGLSAVHSAAPGSALWPARTAMFGDRSVEMELASTLDEAGAASDAGDVERAQELLERAERLMAEVGEADRPALESQMRETVEKVRTVTRAPETVTNERTTTRRETQTLEPGTVTHTEVRTETVTETVTRSADPSSSVTSKSEGTPLNNGHLPAPTIDPEPLGPMPPIPGQ